MECSKEDKQLLLDLAKKAIAYGLDSKKTLSINEADYPAHLFEKRACFVTLKINGQLRGCIGSLEAYQPLIQDVVHNAYASAFNDPRFLPLSAEEFPKIEIHISVLTKPEPMFFSSEEDLIRQLQPNVDGLVLTENGYRGTFLPSVWEELPTPTSFLQHLKLKAGLPMNYWSPTVKIQRYTVESIP